MNRFRKALCVALVLLLLVASVPAVPVADLGFGITASALNATGKCGKTATYTFDSATGKLTIEGTGKINAEAFYSNQDIKEVVICDGITEIGADAFNNCDNLTTVDFGNTVTVIGYKAFYDCYNLTSIDKSDSVITIGDNAFCYCKNLASVVIGDAVKTIGNGAFQDCDNLTSVEIPDSVVTVECDTFWGCDNLISVDIGKSVKTIYGGAFGYCINLTSVTVGSSVETIDYSAFCNCTSLESINIPKTVTYIGEEAFRYCPSLTDVYYEGAEENWNAINIREYNTALENAEIHFAETHTHTWDVEEITKYPTCTEKGEKTISCKGAVCKKTEEIPALGHNFVDYYSNNDATCYKDGTKTATCNRCWGEKDTIVDEGSKDKVAHKFDNGKCTVCGAGCEHENLAWYDGYDATCTSEGFKEHYECKDCYQYLDSNKYVVDKYDLIVPKGEHKFTHYYVIKDATCTANAIEKAVCDFCGEATHEREIVGTMVAHTFKNYISDCNATCVADGTMTAICEMCIEAKDTKVDVGSKNNAPHVPDKTGTKCTLCGAELVCTHTYSVEKLITKTPTCTTYGEKAIVCSKCHAIKPGSEEVVPALGHDWDEGVVTKEPTCVNGGEMVHKCLRYCGKTMTETIDKREHTYKEVITHATCTEDGYSTFTCTMCGSHYVDKPVKAYGHMFETYFYDEGSATCYMDGSKTSVCANGCGTKNTIADPGSKLDHELTDFTMWVAPTCTTDGEEIAKCFYYDKCGYSELFPVEALGHDDSGKFVETKAATCTEKGEKTKTCTRCPEIIAKEVIPALGHDIEDEYTVDVAPTCEKEGSQSKHCSRCDYKDVVIVIPSSGHDMQPGEGTTATCTEPGKAKFICANGCGRIIEEANVPALGHTFNYTSNGDATCQADGTKTGKCIRCDVIETVTDEGSMLEHKLGSPKYVDATCTTDGLMERKCVNCDYAESKYIPALGHDYEEVYEKQPTCTEDGYFEYSCTRCGDWYSKTVESYGHDAEYFEEPATCTEDGSYEYYCYRCGYSESGVIEAYGHTYPDQWSVIIPATCKETGVAVKVCFDCHEVIAMVVPKAGHSDFDGDSKCDTCGGTITVVEPEKPAEKPEEKPCNCDCHAGGIKAFFFKLINFFAKIFDKNARVCDCGKAH